MLKSDYRFENRELESFYRHVATKRPTEQHRGGGIRIIDHANREDIKKAKDNLDIFRYYQREFIKCGLVQEYIVLEGICSNSFSAVREWERRNGVKDEESHTKGAEHGEILVKGRLSRLMRSFCIAMNSVLNNKPNEYARYLFDGVMK